jgi:8-oxo-dGTP pyrophosphatase MutT (NUDIX family)
VLQRKPGDSDTYGQVFISYSHRDKKWLEELLLFLKPDIRRETIYVWDDSKIEAGAERSKEIEQALAAASVAVLLVSSHFLASDSITNQELPNLLARKKGLTIFWIALSECAWSRTPIAAYQAAHEPSRPLNSLSKANRDKAWSQICEKIIASFTFSRSSGWSEQRETSSAGVFDPSVHDREETSITVTGETIVVASAQDAEQDHRQQLLAGYVSTEYQGQEFVLVRDSGRLPLLRGYAPGRATVEQTINETLLAFFTELGIATEQLVAAGFSQPVVQQLYRIDQTRQIVERRPCIFFRLSLHHMVSGSSALWQRERYRWAPKQEVARLWRLDDFRYGQEDPKESLQHFIDDPYEALTKDWISLELGRKILICVDMLIFRVDENGEIAFLLIQRRNNQGWEYPKGGLFYYETPLEGALREIQEETGIAPAALWFCGNLGWQTADVRARGKYYDTLRVHGLTFAYHGDGRHINLDANHQAYGWYPFQKAVAALWIPYGPEFFKRWEEQRQEIVRRAGLAGDQDSKVQDLSAH